MDDLVEVADKPLGGLLVAQDASTDVWALPDGRRLARLHGGAVNVRSKAGTWERLDARWVARDGRLRPAVSPLGVSVAEAVGQGPLVELAGEGWSAGFGLEWPGPLSGVKANVNAGAVTFGLPGGVVLREDLSGEGLKESFVLPKPPAGGADFVARFPVSLVGVAVDAGADGGLVLRRPDGAVVASVPVGLAFDSSKDVLGSPRTSPVAVSVDRTGKGPVVELRASGAWLSAKERVYPVTVDPSLVADGSTGRDAYVTSACGTCTYNSEAQREGAEYVNKVGYVSGTEYASYAKFDVSPLAGKYVTSAAWKSLAYSTTGAPGRVAVVPLAQDFNDYNVTFNTRPNHRGVNTVVDVTSSNQWVSADVTPWVRSWADGTWPTFSGYAGFALDTQGQASWGSTRLGASENQYGSGADAYLEVVYHVYNPAPPASPPDGQTLATATPTLTATAASPLAGHTASYWFNIVAGTGSVTSSGWIPQTSWAPPAGSLRNGFTYTWSVHTLDSIDGYVGMSAWRSLTVDQRLGSGGPSPTDQMGPFTVNLASGNVATSLSTPTLATGGGDIGLSLSYDSLADTEGGLEGAYFNCPNREKPAGAFNVPAGWGSSVAVRNDAPISMSWGTASPAPGVNADNFCVDWAGYVTFPYAASNWQLQLTNVDDGVMVWVDNAVYIDNWADQGPHTQNCTVAVCTINTTGSAPMVRKVRIAYYDRTFGASINLKVVGPNNVDVPASWLSATTAAVPDGWSLSEDTDGGSGWASADIGGTSIVLATAEGDVEEWKLVNGAWVGPEDDDGTLTRDGSTGEVRYQDGSMSWLFDKNGTLKSVTTLTVPGTFQPVYVYDPGNYRLTAIRDNQAPDRAMNLFYGTRDSGGANDPQCPQSAATFGTDAPPPGKLCKITLQTGLTTLTTRLYYNQYAQLARFENPGGAITELVYGAGGKLEMLGDTTAVDAVAAGQADPGEASYWKVAYQVLNEVPNEVHTGIATGTTAPAPQPSATRPAHTYERVAGETRVQVAGFTGPPAAPWSRKVTYDLAGRGLTETDAAGLTTTATWNDRDQQASITDPVGLRSTTRFDHLHRPVAAHGPAPISWFNADGAPTAAHGPSAAEADRVPTSTTGYDEGLVGLRADYYNSVTPGIGNPAASGVAAGIGAFYTRWGTGSPAAGVNADGWSATLTGTLTLPQATTYTIGMASGDGARLWVDGQLLLDDWNTPGPFAWKTPDATIVSATPNSKHKIRVEVMDTTGEELVHLRLDGANLPADLLSPDLSLVTSTIDPDGNRAATTSADPIKGTTAASVTDPAGLRLAAAAATDTHGRRIGKRLPANTYAAAVAADSPWAHWRLNDRTLIAADAAGTRTGTYYSGGSGSPGRDRIGALVADDDRGLTMSGAADPSFVELPTDTLRGGGTSGTIEAWIAPTGPGGIISETNSTWSNYVPVLYIGSDNLLRAAIWGHGQITATASLVNNGWHHVALTWTPGTQTLYVDGQVAGTSTGTADHLDMSFNHIGVVKANGWPADPAPGQFSYYKGQIDEVAAYRTALPAARITAHRNRGLNLDSAAVTTAYYTTTTDPIAQSAPCGGGFAIVGLASQTTEADPDGTGPAGPIVRQQVYDDLGRTKGTRVVGDLNWSCATYDPRGRTTAQTNRVGVTASTTYASDGLTTTFGFTDFDGTYRTTTTVVDLLGRNVRYTDEHGTITRTTYHQTGQPHQTYRTLPGGTETLLATAESDTAGRPWKSIEHVSGAPRTTTVAYDPATGRPTTTTLPNGIATILGYDTNRGWATTTAWARNGTTTAPTWTQTKTISGRTTADTAPGVINRAYAYDGANRLTTLTDGASTRRYAYDRNTNRCGLAATCDGQWTVDQADRLQASPQASAYTYDWRGNLTGSTPRPGKTSATQILYDGWDHARVLNDGTTTATSTLDPTGRLLRRKVTRNSDNVVLEDTTYGYAAPADTPAWHRPTNDTNYTTHLGGGATDTGGVATWPLANPHGDLIGSTDSAGTFIPQGLADEFGNGPVNNDRNGWLGTHERSVDHTTLGWYRMGVRLYDPTTARFHAVDPIEGGSANDYAYPADPINLTDLSGMAVDCEKQYQKCMDASDARAERCEEGCSRHYRTNLPIAEKRKRYAICMNGCRDRHKKDAMACAAQRARCRRNTVSITRDGYRPIKGKGKGKGKKPAEIISYSCPRVRFV